MLGRTLDDSYPDAIRQDLTTVTAARIGAIALYRYAAPFLAVIASSLHVSIAELGVALTVAELGAFTSPVIGHVVDRLSRRSGMALGLVGVSIGGFGVALSGNIVGFTLGLVVLSVAKIVFDLSMGSWITDHVPFARRGRVVGRTEIAWALGLLVGVSTMGLITAAASWPWAYAAAATVVAAMAVVVWVRIDPASAGQRAQRQGPGAASVAARIPFAGWLAMFTMFAMSAASQAIFVTFGAWLEVDFGVSTVVLAGITFALGAAELAASTLSSLRTDAWGKERSILGGTMLMTVAAIVFIALVGHPVAGMIVIAVFIGGFEFALVSAVPIGGDLIPGRPARGLGLLLAATAIGRGAMTIPATRLFDAHGIGSCGILAAALAIAAAAAIRWRHLLMVRGSV